MSKDEADFLAFLLRTDELDINASPVDEQRSGSAIAQRTAASRPRFIVDLGDEPHLVPPPHLEGMLCSHAVHYAR